MATKQAITAADPMDDEEQYADAEDIADGGADDDEEGDGAEDNGFDAGSDTHGAMNIGGHTHGKYGRHGHDDNADHSGAPLKAGKGAKMSENGRESKADAVRLAELETELAQLREANETQARKLYEREIGEQLGEAQATLGADATFSKAFSEKYRAIMLSDAVRDDAGLRAAIHGLVTATAKHVVDTRALGASFDQEQRRTRKAGGAASDDETLLAQAEKIALSEHKKALSRLSDDERTEVLLAAAREVGYTGAE